MATVQKRDEYDMIGCYMSTIGLELIILANFVAGIIPQTACCIMAGVTTIVPCCVAACNIA